LNPFSLFFSLLSRKLSVSYAFFFTFPPCFIAYYLYSYISLYFLSFGFLFFLSYVLWLLFFVLATNVAYFVCFALLTCLSYLHYSSSLNLKMKIKDVGCK